MKLHYILTTFSPSMFGSDAVVRIKQIPNHEAAEMVDEHTKIVASRISHERLARAIFPNASEEVGRYAQLPPGKAGVLVHYRGPPVSDTGEVPEGGTVTCYLLESRAP